MKVLSYSAAIVGFLLIIGTAGSSDFYEECRAAADCVAGEPMSYAQMLTQCLVGIVMMGLGVLGVIETSR